MSTSEKTAPKIQAHFLERGIHQINNAPELNQDLIGIFLSLEKFHREIQDCKTCVESIAILQEYLEGMNVFHQTAFYMVDDDFCFNLMLSSNPKSNAEIEALMAAQIKSGHFAWALQQNRSVLVDTPSSLPGEHTLLHSMSTHSKTLGMFIGFLKEDNTLARSSMMSLLSIMIASTVYVWENQVLQNELLDHNRQLEATVNERTQELCTTNETLHASNAELKRLNEKKSEFLGIAAHDLKNPLTAIMGCTHLVKDALNDSKKDNTFDLDDNLDMLKRVEDSASHMVKVIEDLMNSESLESGQVNLKPSKQDLGVIAKKVVIINQAQAQAKSIEIHLDIDENMMVKADPLRMHESIDNFVSNSIKYSAMDSNVWVSVKKWLDKYDNEWIRLSVRDEGPGLTENDKKKLFGRFQKLSARPTAGESSTGLGLSIVKRLVELHYGQIGVESEHGKGSEFYFRLPHLKG